jgi:hypothetical protein
MVPITLQLVIDEKLQNGRLTASRRRKLPGLRQRQKLPKVLRYCADANILTLASRALNDLCHTFGNLLADVDAEGYAHQVSVLELNPWPFVAVV